MDENKLEEVLCYGKKVSGIFEGKNVRGFFGRGLKEAIIALGVGEISSVSNGFLTKGHYYYDLERNKLVFKPTQVREKTDLPSGTKVKISCRKNEELKCPDFANLVNKLQEHFSLRDILSNNNRRVSLTMEKIRNKKRAVEGEQKIRYEASEGQQIENKKIYLKGFGIADFKLYETAEKLYFQRHDPCSRAGILIRTSNAILENTLFGFDNDPFAYHFFGEIRCPGIFEKIRLGEPGLIRPDRKGLYWNHAYFAELEKNIKETLQRHIERKRKQAEVRFKPEEMPQERKEKLYLLFKKLNRLSARLLGDLGPGDFPEPEKAIERLEIYPSEAIAPPHEERVFSVYLPFNKFRQGVSALVQLDNPKGKFDLPSKQFELKKHKKRDELAFGYFKIIGFRPQDRTGIIVKYGNEEDIAEFVVGLPRKKPVGPRPQPKSKAGGLFKEINFNSDQNNPSQRVFYERNTGRIIIYLNYPGVAPYLGINGEGMETDRGSMLLSELIADAFCRVISRRKVEDEPLSLEGQLDQFLSVYNDNLKICLPIIHNILIK